MKKEKEHSNFPLFPEMPLEIYQRALKRRNVELTRLREENKNLRDVLRHIATSYQADAATLRLIARVAQ